MYCGVPYAPIAPSYSLLARQYDAHEDLRGHEARAGLRRRRRAVPSALESVCPPGVEVVSCASSASMPVTPFDALDGPRRTGARRRARRSRRRHYRQDPLHLGIDRHAEGVINTQRMLCANQEMIRTVMALLADEPPILCDWLPWNHTFGGNHNFGLVSTTAARSTWTTASRRRKASRPRWRNLREIATTAYFNVPRGYDLLVPVLGADAGFRDALFSRVKMLFCAAAALRQEIAEALERAALDARRTGSVRHRARRDRERAICHVRRRLSVHRWADRRARAWRRAEAGAGQRQA